MKNLLKKGVSLMLVFAMLMGLCTSGFASLNMQHTATENAPVYVSLGDSMTNGYGLEGYAPNGMEVNGYLTHAMDSYACRFAEAYGFEHIPMAISAMRAEDLHFILEFPYENEEAVKLVEGSWNEEAWNEMFSVGDYYTWDEFTHNRFHDYAKYGYSELSGTAAVAENFQTAVAEADIISMSIGNANFGVFLMYKVLDAMSIMGGDPAKTEWYQLERALAECDEETRVFVLDIYDELMAKIGDSEQAQTVARVLAYCALSYILNYAGVIERIVELNPDVEIMLVGLINTMYGMKISGDFGEIDLGEILGDMIGSMNAYIATLPAVFQLTGKYTEATFYFAEATNVELIYTELDDAAAVNFEGYETVRNRIITQLNQMVLDTNKASIALPLDGVGVPGGITLEQIKQVESGNYNLSGHPNLLMTCAVYLALEKAIVEAAELESLDISSFSALTDLGSVFMPDENGEGGLDLTFLDGLMATVGALLADGDMMAKIAIMESVPELKAAFLNRYTAWLQAQGIDVTQVYLSKMAEIRAGYMSFLLAAVAGINENEMFGGATVATASDVTDEEWTAIWATMIADELDLTAAQELFAGQIDVAPGFEAYADTVKAGAWATIWVNDALPMDMSELYANAKMLEQNKLLLPLMADGVDVMAIAMPAVYDWLIPQIETNLAKSLNSNKAVNSLLHLFARMLIGNGIGAHPSADGHDTLFNEIVKAYDDKNTVDQEVTDRIKAALKVLAALVDEYHDEAYAYGYQYALENGYIDAANAALDAIEAELNAIAAELNVIAAEMSDTIAAALASELEAARATIAALRDVINSVDYDAVVAHAAKLVAELQKTLCNIVDLLHTAHDDIAAAAIARVEALNIYIEKTVLPAIDKTIREASDYAIAYLRAKTNEVYNELVNHIAEMYPIAKPIVLDFLYARADEIVELTVAYGPKLACKLLITVVDLVVEYGPEVADWTYDFLLNNPDKVIAFLNENNGNAEPYAMAVLGFVWYQYGDEIIDFVIKNQTEILTVMAGMLKTYGPDAWSLIKVYAQELGLLEKLPVTDSEQLENILSKLADLLGKYGMDLVEKYNLLDKLEAAVVELREAVTGHTNVQLEDAIVRVEASIAKIKVMIEDRENLTIEKLGAAVVELETAMKDLFSASEAEGEDLVDRAMAWFEQTIDGIYVDATRGEYAKGEDSYYIAIGDGSITGNSYVDVLAEQLGVEYKNIGADGLSAADCAVVLEKYVQEIASADLITIGFSNNTMIDYMVDQMKASLLGAALDEYDWSKYLDEDGVADVEKALADVRAELIAMGIVPVTVLGKKIDVVDLMMIAAESYAYAYAGYVFGYPALIEAIRTINSDALIVTVGLNNPLKDLAFKQNDKVLAVGEYIQYLIDAANAEALALAVLSGETVFVDAPDVETIAEENNSAVSTSIARFILNVIIAEEGTAVFYASADGHAYIAEQILNALTITEKPDVVMGDLTGDGVVDVGDAVMLLKAIASKTTGEFSAEKFVAADVTRDGMIDVGDAVKLLKAIASKTTGEL